MTSLSIPPLREHRYSDTLLLRENAAGEFLALHSALKNNDHASFEDLTIYKYKVMIVLVSAWEIVEDTRTPWLWILAKNYYSDPRRPADAPPSPLPETFTTLGDLFRSIPPNDFMEIVDRLSDELPKVWVEELYTICDEDLFPTSAKTKEALKEPSTPATPSGSATS